MIVKNYRFRWSIDPEKSHSGNGKRLGSLRVLLPDSQLGWTCLVRTPPVVVISDYFHSVRYMAISRFASL